MRKLLIILFCLISVSLNAATYYVATAAGGGDDDHPGTIAEPWLTWNKAFTSVVVAGDTVFFRGGVYQTTVINGLGIRANRSGSVGDWIVYINYPGETPIIDFGNIVAGDIQYTGLQNYGLVTLDISYVKIKGLTVRNVKQYFDRNYGIGIYLKDGYVILENCTVYNCWGVGIKSEHNSSNDGDYGVHYITNCDSYNICDSISGSPAGSNAGNVGTGFTCHNDYSSLGESYFTSCRAWHCSDQGFNFSPNSYIKAVGCWSFDNQEYVQGSGGGYKLGWQDWEAYFIRREIFNCIAVYNDGYGFFTNETGSTAPWWAVRSHHYNNIAYHNGLGAGSEDYGFIIRDTQQADSIEQTRVFSNNISYDNPYNLYDAAGAAKYSGTKNTWQAATGVTVTDADFVSLDTAGITAARQTDGSLPDNPCYNNFLHLASTSDLINAGVDVGIDYNGSAPDLGPFEYTEATPPAAPQISTYEPYNITLNHVITGGYMIYDGGGTISAKGICWAIRSDPDLTDNVISGGTGTGNFTVTVSGLTGHTTYHVRAYATNENGTAYGADEAFTTSQSSIIKHAGKIVKR
jgi:hypothetical protein